MNDYRVKVVFCVFISVGFVTMFFVNPYGMIDGVSKGLKLCATAVIPSLFPFVVLSDFLVRSRTADLVGRFLAPVTKFLFRLPGSAGCAVLMSMVGGYPVGAKMTAQLFESGKISSSQAKRMMLFCVNAGPAFVTGTVGVLIFSNRMAGIILYLSMVVSSLLIGMFSRIFEKGSIEFETKKVSFETGVISQSVMQGVNTTLFLCAWVILFSCVSFFVDGLPLPYDVTLWLKMLTEVTDGCFSAADKFPMSIQALIMGWSGLSVHCQLLPYIKQTQTEYLHFALARIIHGGLSATLADFLFRVFKCETDVFSTHSEVVGEIYSVSIPAAISLIVLSVLLITDVNIGKRKNNGEA